MAMANRLGGPCAHFFSLGEMGDLVGYRLRPTSRAIALHVHGSYSNRFASKRGHCLLEARQLFSPNSEERTLCNEEHNLLLSSC